MEGEAGMDRRAFLGGGIALGAMAQLPALAQTPPTLDDLLAQAADPSVIEAGWAYRDVTRSRGVGTGRASSRALPQRAIDMIVAFEVASPAVYTRRWQRPIWPKGASGVTIGVGYDLRFANRRFLDRDWPMLSATDRATLATVLGLSGERAHAAIPSVQSVVVPWPAAQTQFLAFLPYQAAQTEDAFANTHLLADESFGALVSLIYNRGAAMPRNSASRLEMRQIRDLMAAKTFAPIPDRIRAMKRLWPQPDARGLLIRRDAEALLFEMGLRRA